MQVYLRDNEHIVDEAHFHWIVFFGPNIMALLGLGVAFLAVADYVGPRLDIEWLGHIFKLPRILLGLGLLMMCPAFYVYLDNKLKHYIVTGQRIFIKRGVLAVNYKEIPIVKVNDVRLSQTLAQRILGAGNIEILTGNEEGVFIKNISHPQAFKESIMMAIREGHDDN